MGRCSSSSSSRGDEDGQQQREQLQQQRGWGAAAAAASAAEGAAAEGMGCWWSVVVVSDCRHSETVYRLQTGFLHCDPFLHFVAKPSASASLAGPVWPFLALPIVFCVAFLVPDVVGEQIRGTCLVHAG